MFSLFKKEIADFFHSAIGYLVMVVFLVGIGLFMWVFPIELNVLNSGRANMDALFTLGPWVFLFLGPAVCMRLFAEEKRSGTLELLLTKPVSEWQLVGAKFLAGWVLMLLALLPTVVYFYSVYSLGSPVGNLDVGGVIGSYVGLALLAAAYVSIGLLASALSSNQIVAFIAAVFACFTAFIGFESLAPAVENKWLSSLLINLGINAHYTSLGRGVIDSRDVVYFITLMGVFLALTKTKLEARKW